MIKQIKLLSYFLISFALYSCSSIFSIDWVVRKASKPTQIQNKYRIDLLYDDAYGGKKLLVKSKQEIKDYFAKHSELSLDEKSIEYTEYKGKKEIASFEYYGKLKEIEQNAVKKQEALISKGNSRVEALMKSSKTTDGINYSVENYIYQHQPTNYYPKKDVDISDITRFLDEKGYKIVDVKYMKQVTKRCNSYPCNEEYKSFIGSFTYTKMENFAKIDCEKAIKAMLMGRMSSLCPSWSENEIQDAISKCKKCNMEESVAYEIYKHIPVCFNRESFVRIFPNSKYTPSVQKVIDDINSGKKKDERQVLAEAVAGSIKETVENVQDAFSNKDDFSVRNVNSNEVEIISQINVRKYEFSKTTYQGGIDFFPEKLMLNIGCNDYSHSLDKENEGFKIIVETNGKTVSNNKDIMNVIDPYEINLSQYQFKEDAIVTISFFSANKSYTELKLRINKGGAYRIEIFPKN